MHRKGSATIVIIIATLVIILIGGWYFLARTSVPAAPAPAPAQSSGRQAATSTVTLKSGGVQSTLEAGTVCYDSPAYFVIMRPNTGEVGSQMLVKYKTTPEETFPCEYSKAAGDYELAIAGEPDYFLALDGSYLLLDSGTAPYPRGLIVFDLTKRARVFTDRYSQPIDITSGGVTYWSPTGTKPTAANCPDLSQYTSNGLGAEIEAHVTLDLATLQKTDLGESRCSATQG